jgi:hypothetical protein
LTESLEQAWQDRPARRDLAEQILAVHEHAAAFSGEDGSDLTQAVLRLRGWALWFLNDLGDSAAQAIQVAEPLLADRDRVLGADHRDTLSSRNDLALAYMGAGPGRQGIHCTSGPWPRKAGPGPDHPSTLASRVNLAAARTAPGDASACSASEAESAAHGAVHLMPARSANRRHRVKPS